MLVVARAAGQRDHAERADDRDAVREQVEERAGGAPLRGRLDPHQDEPGVAHRRVGQHALHVGLHDRQHGADHQREQRQGVEHRAPVVDAAGEREHEHPQDAGEAGGLGGRGHEARHRRGRPLVHVGRPRVERGGRHLEAQAHEQQREAGQQQAAALLQRQHVAVEEQADVGQVRGAGGAVHERHAVEEEGRREGAEHEVLDRRLLRPDVTAVAGGQHVEGDRQRLEPQEQHDHVVGHRHDHAAQGRQQDQRVDLGPVLALAPQVLVEEQRRERGGHRHGEREEQREVVERHGAGHERGRTVTAHVVPQEHGEHGRRRRGGHGHEGEAAPGPAIARERRAHQQRQAAAEQHEQRRQAVPVDARPLERVGRDQQRGDHGLLSVLVSSAAAGGVLGTGST